MRSNNASTKSTPTKPTRNGAASIYEQIGGEKAVLSACGTFVARLAKDPRTAKPFASLNDDQQVMQLSGFLAHVTGGPAYTGPSMYEFHRHLTLTDAHFDAYLEILEESLLDCDMPKMGVEKIMREVKEQRGDVLGKGKKAAGLFAWMGQCCGAAGCGSEAERKAMVVHAAGAAIAVGILAAVSYYAIKTLRKHD